MLQPDPDSRPHSSRLFLDTEPVYPGVLHGPRFGDLAWNIAPLATRATHAERELDFADMPASWALPIREVMMVLAQPDHPRVIAAGVIRRAKPAPFGTLVRVFAHLRVIAAWAIARDLYGPATWTQTDADALLDDLRAGHHRENGGALTPDTVRHYVILIKQFRTFGPALTDGGLAFQPWGGRSPNNVAEAVRPVENKTPPLRWDTWAPLVAASWAFVDRFSSDILGALAAAASLPREPRGPSGPNALPAIRSWAARAGKVPLHTGVGRGGHRRGQPNTSLLSRQLGINDMTFKKNHGKYCAAAIDLVAAMTNAPERSCFGGIWAPTVLVTLDDGTERTWIDEIGRGELDLLVSILRASAYVLLASLTGMRDSEIQELTRDTSTSQDGLPAIASTQFKGEQSPNGRPRAWFGPPPVFRTLDVLQALSRHSTHLFARSESNAGNYLPARDIRRLISFVNGDPATRPGRGHGLGLSTIHPTSAANINQTALRRSFCVYAARYPGAELGLGIQLGHAALRTTTGYMIDSQQQTARLFSKDRQDIAREQVAALVLDAPPLTGAPSAELSTMRAQIIADPARADRIVSSVGEHYHLGFFNDCLWRQARSGCGPDGPHLAQGVCKGAACGNALFRPEHLPPVTAHVERIDAFLDSGRGHPALLDDLRKQRTLYSRVIDDLQATAPDED